MCVELKAPEAIFCFAGEVQKIVNIYSSKTENNLTCSAGERERQGGEVLLWKNLDSDTPDS